MSDSDVTIDSDELEDLLKQKKPSDSSPRKPSTKKVKRSVKLHEISDSSDEDEDSTPAKKPKKVEKHVLSPMKRKTLERVEGNESPKSTAVGRTPAKTDTRPLCQYGSACYRKNPEHRKQFRHSSPDAKNAGANTSSKNTASESQSNNFHFEEKLGIYFTTVHGIDRKYNDHIARSIKDLLSPKMGTLVRSAQFNYMFDIPWLIDQYPQEFRSLPILLVHGEQRESKKSLEKSGAAFSNIKFCQAKLEITYGTHHTKMMLLLYKEGLRIVIHTSNLVPSDWYQKTQGMWISPLFPKLNETPSVSAGDSPTKFKTDLVEYLSAYGNPEINEWCHHIKSHDLSKARVFLIGSVPGRHLGTKKTCFGHLKLRKVLNAYGPDKDKVTSSWSLVSQFSSIGSLGSTPEAWLEGEWLASFVTTRNTSLTPKSVPLKLIYPTVENVRKSLEGYPAGASLPYSINVAKKQPWLNKFLHNWKSDYVGRSEASPHIKSYLRLSPDSKFIAWFLITSANLSKAAWGAFEKSGSQLMIRSYELGLLFLPDQCGKQDVFLVPGQNASKSTSLPIPVPFDIPLLPYGSNDRPWIWDIPHMAAPDRYDNKWCPPL